MINKKRRGYLFHKNDSTTGQTFTNFIVDQRYDAIALYWHIIELINAQGGTGKCTVMWSVLCHNMNMKRVRLTKLVVYMQSTTTHLKYISNEFEIVFLVDNYAEYQETKSQKREKKPAENVPIKDKRLKIKDYKLKNIKKESPFLAVLEDIYNSYPLKVGKKRGMQIAQRDIKSEEDCTALRTAIANYCGYLDEVPGRRDFIKQFSSFMGDWRPWVEFKSESKRREEAFLEGKSIWA